MVASFSSLPEKLRLYILHLIGRTEPPIWLPCHASVAREWQTSFEPFTFRKLYITARRLQDFGQIVVGERRAHVQTIHLHVILDTYREHSSDRKESKKARRRNTDLFNSFVHDFLQTMTEWRRDETSPYGIQLNLEVDSPSDLDSILSTGTRHLTQRARESIFRLDDDSLSFPSVNVVSGLRCSTGRHIEPTSVLVVATALRNLQSLDVKLNHDSSDDYDVEQRAKFITSLAHSLPTLTHLSLHRPSTPPGSSTAPSPQSWSPVPESLRTFSQQLTSLIFDDTISVLAFLSPFLPSDGSPIYSPPHWPRLKNFKIRNSYLLQNPYKRAISRAEAGAMMHRVLVGVGRGAAYMPRLGKARVVQCMLTKTGVKWVILTYQWGKGSGAMLEIRGMIPGNCVVDEWKAAVASTRGVELRVVIDERDPGQYQEDSD